MVHTGEVVSGMLVATHFDGLATSRSCGLLPDWPTSGNNLVNPTQNRGIENSTSSVRLRLFAVWALFAAARRRSFRGRSRGIRTLRAIWRTWEKTLNGHEGGNLNTSQGRIYGLRP